MKYLNNLVSIIIPTYNCEKYILNTIKSVINQTYNNWELIIIDDHSPDSTSKVVSDYINKNNLANKIKLIRNEYNRGCYCSLNVGIQNSKGSYLCILGSDDTYDINKLKLQTQILDNYDKFICTMGYYKRANKVIRRNKMTVCTAMFRRKVIDKIGYFDSVRYSADDEFMRRMIKVYGDNKIHMMKKILYYAIIRIGSLTQSKKTGYKNKNRKQYWNTAIKWQDNNKKLYISFPLKKRPFSVAKEMIGH